MPAKRWIRVCIGLSPLLFVGACFEGLDETSSHSLATQEQAVNPKVLICHVPPGNPGNEHTIEVSANAVSAHLAHGDRLDACDAPREPKIGRYREGFGFDKELDVCNDTRNDINLDGYTVEIGFNGRDLGDPINAVIALEGNLAPGGCVVLCHDANDGCISDSNIQFNGNDAVAIVNPDGIVVDLLGQFGLGQVPPDISVCDVAGAGKDHELTRLAGFGPTVPWNGGYDDAGTCEWSIQPLGE